MLSEHRMTTRRGQGLRRAVLAAAIAAGAAGPVVLGARDAYAQGTVVKPGFNIFSREQELQAGQQAAAQAERQLPILRDSEAQDYVSDIVRRLAAQAPGDRWPYQIKVVNASDVNAFALPGGYMYVNRGLIQAARSEGELAGVLAHEMAHVALRHATHQASKAYATQTGVGVLGGLLGLGRGGGIGAQVQGLIANLALNALFLKYSRDDETQADIVGSQIMYKAGYNPQDMVSFFELLQSQQRGNPSAVSQFFASHPAPANRAQRIRAEAQKLGPVRTASTVGSLQQVQGRLRQLGAAPTMAQIQRGQVPRGSTGDVYSRGRVNTGRVDAPSGRYRGFQQRDDFFTVQYPDNWEVHEAQSGLGVTIAPAGGIVQASDGTPVIVYGAIFNHYDPFDQRFEDDDRITRDYGNLGTAMDDLVQQVRSGNPYLRNTGAQRRLTIDGAPALQTVLSGTSPLTGMEERVTVFARELEDGHIAYALFIAPARDYNALAGTFDRMISSFRVNDAVSHR
jgi:Zn-dependent protease with chaperone function